MSVRQLLRPRPRLMAVTRLSHPIPRPMARFSSTEAKSKSTSAGTIAASFAAGLTSAALLYWFTTPRTHPTPGPAKPPSTTSDEQSRGIPDLNKLGLSDQIAYSPTPTPESVTQQLNELAFSLSTGGGNLVTRYDGTQLGSNSPCEDAFIHGYFSNPIDPKGDDWAAWGVFDGHCGWQLSDLLTRQLMPYVRRALSDAKPTDEETIQQAIKSAFTKLDDALVKSAAAIVESDLPFAEKARRLEAAYAGSCALLALLDPLSKNLTVASTGDCRAVLGRKSADGTWVATDLTTDCTGATPAEADRIRAQFPDEPNVVRGGRIWGMQPSRTFGDGMWKWTSTLKENLRNHYNGLSLPSAVRYSGYRDGPYLTAEPLVTTTKIPESEPSFVILSTDGLWDTMTSAQAVDLVGKWIEWQAQGDGKPIGPQTADFGPTILGRRGQCKYEEPKATVQDDNAAVHLVRNGLGGGDEEMVKGALTFRYPNSRDIRDDMTVQVVFFNLPKGKQ
ncbi:protein serine/threonine phosphatase 2C [Hypoxylon crocopeplum]|nr:protein serine/threonine phosphatase 2C [Hypoxylon crocopeplum]